MKRLRFKRTDFKINSWPQITATVTYGICNSLFGKVNQQFRGRGLTFDSTGVWSHKAGGDGRNVITLGTDNSVNRFQANW